MGREVRRVPPDWNHPRKENGSYQPMYNRSYDVEAAEWNAERAMWLKGLRQSYGKETDWEPIEEEYRNMTFTRLLSTDKDLVSQQANATWL